MILDHGLTYTYEKNRIADEFVEIKFHIINEKEIERPSAKTCPDILFGRKWKSSNITYEKSLVYVYWALLT